MIKPDARVSSSSSEPVTGSGAAACEAIAGSTKPGQAPDSQPMSDGADSGTGAATAAESDGSTAPMSDEGTQGERWRGAGSSSAAGSSVAAQASRAGSARAARPLVSELRDLLPLTLPRTLDPNAVAPPGLGTTGVLDFGTDATEVDPSSSLAKVARRQALAVATQTMASSSGSVDRADAMARGVGSSSTANGTDGGAASRRGSSGASDVGDNDRSLGDDRDRMPADAPSVIARAS